MWLCSLSTIAFEVEGDDKGAFLVACTRRVEVVRPPQARSKESETIVELVSKAEVIGAFVVEQNVMDASK